MKLGKNRIHFLIMLVAVFSLLVHVPSDVYAANGDVKSTVEINQTTTNVPALENQDFSGYSVANIGDLDGDGVNDLAVGIPRAGHLDPGEVRIMFMNADGSVKSTVEIDKDTANGPSFGAGDYFGSAIANIGDLNDDGVNDIAVGAEMGDGDKGEVHIMFMNTDGSIDSSVEISALANGVSKISTAGDDYFGRSVANIGDLDGDGVNDLAVGAPGDHAGGTDRGQVYIIFMNADGSVDSTVKIDDTTANGPALNNADYFGRSVANIGDLDGDGVNDLAVGAPQDNTGGAYRGTVHILFMNADGSVDSTVEIDDDTTNGPDLADEDYFGSAVANIGDLNDDGVNDLAVGASHDAEGGADRGTVHILFMNADGSVDSTVEINDSTANGPALENRDFFGYSVANIGDLDGDGVNDLAVGAPQDNAGGSDRGTVHIMLIEGALSSSEDSTTGEEKESSSDACYDCEAPKLTKVEVHVSSSPFDYVWNFEQDTPYPMFDDDITPIIADPGDEVQIILELTDNRTLERIADSGTYMNFLHKPNNMNNFYANNFDEYGKVSTTFYEWHNTGEDLFYDYDQTVEWSQSDVTIEESAEFVEGGEAPNLDGLVGTFTISFKMKFLQPMQTTDVWVQAIDRSGNFFKVALPLTLKVTGNEPLVFASKVNQKVLGFYDESILNEIVSDWTGSTQDVSELATVLGIADEQLPPWVTNLTVWVSEDKITLADMIVSIEHFINN